MVFLSYAHKDGATTAKDLFDSLQEANLDPWLDQDRLRGGASWSLEIEQALDDCDTVAAILTEGSYRSDICRAEQLRALRKGKRVIPVFVDGDRPLYLEHLQYVQADNLLEALGEPPAAKPLPDKFRQTRYDTVPNLSNNYVPRPQELADLRNAVLADHPDRRVALTAIRGMGGVGKTVMATALAKDPVVLDAYPDGVIWITIGEKPGDPVAAIREAARTLGEPANEWENPNQLRNALRNRAALLILDDVWDAEHALPYLPDNAHCRVLVTTRSSEVAADIGATEHWLDVLPPEEALAMLQQYAGKRPEHAGEIAERCGLLPLALAIIGRLLKRRPEDRVLARLRSRDFDKLDDKILAAVDLSVQALPDALRRRYLDLAVFEADTEFPLSALQALWNDQDELDAADSADSLVEASLLIRRDDLFTLHDIPQAYIASTLKPEALTMSRPRLRGGSANPTAIALHNQLLSGYSQRCPNGWPTGPNDGYFYQHLAHHLVAAGRGDELADLLLDPAWMQSKLRHTSAHELTLDYEPLREQDFYSLLQGAVRLSSGTLDRNPRELSSQLLGRLASFDNDKLCTLQSRLKDVADPPWLEPVRPALTLPGGPLVRTLKGHSHVVNAVAVTVDGQRAVSASMGNTLKVWDLETGHEVRTLMGHTAGVSAVAVTGDGRLAVSASWDTTLKVWDLTSGAEIRTLEGHAGPVHGVAVALLRQRVISASHDQTLKIWDLEAGHEVGSLQGHTASVSAVAVTADGGRAISASADNTLKIWDLNTGQVTRTLQGHSVRALAVAVTTDGQRAVSAFADGILKVWDVASGREISTLHGHTGGVLSIAIDVDDQRAVSASADGTLKVWDLGSGRETQTLTGHAGGVLGVGISRYGKQRAVSACADHTLKVWDLDSSHEIPTTRVHAGGVLAVAVAPDGKRAVSASRDYSLKVWDLSTGDLIFTLLGHSNVVNSVAVTVDSRHAVSASADNTLKVWDLDSGREIQTLQGHVSVVSAVGVAVNSQRAVSACFDNTLKLWDLTSGRELRTLQGHAARILGVAMMADGERAVSASWDRTLKIWDLDSGRVIHTLEGHTDFVNAVAVLGDGQRVISASRDNTLKVWDIESGDELCTFKGHAHWVLGVAACPSARQRFVSASRDHTLRVWDLDCGERCAFTADHAAYAVAFTPDGHRIIAGDQEGNLHILRLHLR